jgi:GNAT superfamily N-acetyltransferase
VTASLHLLYLDLNAPPHLPVDGGQSSLPHQYVAFDGSTPVGLLSVTVDGIIDLVYVIPAARRGGVARALCQAARDMHSRLGTDDRLTSDGLGVARALRLPFYGSGRRRVTMDTAAVDERGARALAAMAGACAIGARPLGDHAPRER